MLRFSRKPFETAAAPQRLKLCVSLASCSNFSKNRVLTIGEERKKRYAFRSGRPAIWRFLRHLLRNIAILRFCDTPRARMQDDTPRTIKSANNVRILGKMLHSPLPKNRPMKTSFKATFLKFDPYGGPEGNFLGFPLGSYGVCALLRHL